MASRWTRRPATFLRGACLAALMVTAGGGRIAAAQDRSTDAYLNQQRALEDDVRRQLERELPADQRINFDWGGWYNSWFFINDDGTNSSRTLRRNDFRLWTGLTLDQGAHELYARGRLSFIDWNRGDSFDFDEDDIEGPNLERGSYQFDLRNAMKAYAHQDMQNNFKIKIGRDLVEFGTGYALSLPMDHVRMTAEISKFEFTGLMGRSVRSISDIDRSRPNADESNRHFWGVQAKYLGFEKHEPFVYVLWNEDQLNESPQNYLQNYDYDTFYTGFGSRGELLKNLRYATEWVFESGNSYGDRKFHARDDVEAWAFDVTLEYLTEWTLKPRFIGEYMYASGDADRFFSPTNAVGGNTRGDDNSFVGFGFRDTGLSFAPRMSNIHIWRLGASIIPFEKVEHLDKIEVGTDWFLYHKQRRRGGVSDATADQTSGYLGWEMDYYANWRFTSDLSWTARYGVFFPGDAFSDQTTRYYFVTGVTWSF